MSRSVVTIPGGGKQAEKPLPLEGELAREEHSAAETFAQSVAILALMTIAGRGIGFIRGLLFCRWLSPQELGLWDLAYGFLMLAAPVTVLGLTSSFRRYLEHYRVSGHARVFLKRVAWATTLLGGVAVTALILGRDSFSRIVFDASFAGRLVALTACALAPLLVFYFAFELFAGLRMFRRVTVLQFIQSVGFAIIACTAIFVFGGTAMVVMASYGIATLLCAAVAIFWMRGAWRSLPTGDVDASRDDSSRDDSNSTASRLSHAGMWGKIVPFAMWMWLTNWLSNLFEISDRYMLVHFGRLDETAALAAVGNYHSARVAPLLLVSIAAMLNSAVLPHLSADWEAGRRSAVSARLAMTLKLMAIVLLGGAVAILTVAPWLFSYGFSGKFAGGQDVLPLTLVSMIWSALALLSTAYLWCAERAKFATLVLAAGLILNIALNVLLVPSFGLKGAVIATATANATVLLGITAVAARFGFTGGKSLLLLFAAPVALLLGVLPTVAVLIFIAHQGMTRNWLLSEQERDRLAEVLASGFARMRRLFRSNAGSPPQS